MIRVFDSRFWRALASNRAAANWATLGAGNFQSSQRSGARTELVGLDAQALEHAHIEIAQRRWAVRIKRQMLAVLEAATGHEHRQILYGMAAAVAQIAAQEDRR